MFKLTKNCLILVIMLECVPAVAQSDAKPCEVLKSAVLHSYPKNSGLHYLQVINGDFMHETNTATGDTNIYKIQWLTDCTLSFQYLGGNEKIPEDNLRFLKRHKVIFNLTARGDDYFVYTAHVDKANSRTYSADTLWLHEKTVAANNLLFTQISADEASQLTKPIDTANYALLYLYRPGKLTNSLSDYLVYFDDMVMCPVHNNSGYVFKVWREGKYKITSRLFKDTSVVEVDIKFGKSYYIKSMVHWTITSRLYNFKLEMADVTDGLGKNEFGKVKLR